MSWAIIADGETGATDVTASAVLAAGTAGDINIHNLTGGPIAIALPAAPIRGQALKFKDVGGNAGTSNITILGTIDSWPSYTLASDYASIELYWMGTQWGTR